MIPQAFLEMASEEAAVTMVNYYTAITPHLRNQPIYIQYSNHKELKTDSALNQVGFSFYCEVAASVHFMVLCSQVCK